MANCGEHYATVHTRACNDKVDVLSYPVISEPTAEVSREHEKSLNDAQL